MSEKLRGFAALSPEQRTALARKGGQTAQARGTGHKWTKEEAGQAGKIGGALTQARRRGKAEDEAQRQAESQS